MDWAGFEKLRPGRIHLCCPRCGRKQSNTPRNPYDPPQAELVRIHCDKCGQGDKDCSQEFFNAHGRIIGWVEIERAHKAADRKLRAEE
jgi:hypothetical protein